MSRGPGRSAARPPRWKRERYEIRIIGAIRRLSEAKEQAEVLTIDEIIAGGRTMFSHLVLTDDDLKRYIAEAKRHDAGSMSARIFAAWKSSDEEGKDRILDEFIEASVSIGNCEPKRVRGFKKLQRNLSRLSNRRGNREVVLPVTMDRDFLKRLRVHAAIENRSLDNFILVALYNAMEVIDDASALTRRVLSKLDAHRIKSLRDCAKLVHTKITCCFPHKN